MHYLSEFLNAVIANWGDVVKAGAAVVFAARVIVKVTPTPKDDTKLAKVINFLGHVGLKLPND